MPFEERSPLGRTRNGVSGSHLSVCRRQKVKDASRQQAGEPKGSSLTACLWSEVGNMGAWDKQLFLIHQRFMFLLAQRKPWRSFVSKTITRTDLVTALNQEVGLSQNECVRYLDSLLDEVADCLVKGEAVKISSFATFSVRDKKERIGRNPKTGEKAAISPRKVVVFRPSQKLKLRINQSEN